MSFSRANDYASLPIALGSTCRNIGPKTHFVAQSAACRRMSLSKTKPQIALAQIHTGVSGHPTRRRSCGRGDGVNTKFRTEGAETGLI